jgi:acetyl-CoA carboxylase biotin carboxylase subunit
MTALAQPPAAPFEAVLVANRGEIALRIARTCREMGIRTVAVHSTQDRHSEVVSFADQSVQIGAAAPRQSYLNPAALVEAARLSGAVAVHPGYGFLSEDADFAAICEEEGLVFVGPPASVLARLADKASVRALMAEAGLPVLGSHGTPPTTVAEAQQRADEIGYPVIIKASAGGGGKGMTVVRDPAQLAAAFTQSRISAQRIFGDPSTYLEPYLEGARHVEVQILADAHGNVIHLGTRDCSVQRRHQKLIEEAPAPGLPPSLVTAIQAAAVAGARYCGYRGAATFEFLVDSRFRFHFLEINCRIQVEHPVTEMITGIDVVREQLLVAAGRPLSYRQEEVEFRGCALECRVNAEDPQRGFVPTPGRLAEFVPPGGPFTRVDTHGRTGLVLTPDYDSLLAKVVTWGPDRAAALARMDRALGEFRISGKGVHTTAAFLRQMLGYSGFAEGRLHTGLVEEMLAAEAS